MADIDLFLECIKQEINIIKQKGNFIPAWNISVELNTTEFKQLIDQLFADTHIKAALKTEAHLRKAFLKASDRYLINISFTGKLKYHKGLATRVYTKWREEISSPNIQTIILASMLNFEVNKSVKIGDIELVPILKNGDAIELEKKVYKLLGFKGVKDIKRIDEFGSLHITYFFGGNAIRIKGEYPKRDEFYEYSSFPEPGHNELLQKIKNFVILLRLFKEGDFIVGSYHSVVTSPFAIGEYRLGEVKYTSGLQYPLVNKSEVLKLGHFAKKFLPLIEKIETLPNGFQIGLEYLNSSYEKNKIHEKFIDIMIAFDALLGTQAETSYRISLRASHFLTKKSSERKEIYTKVKEALKLRGKLVHGDVHPNKVAKGEIEKNKLYIEGIVRKILVKLLTLYSEGKIGDGYKDTFEENFLL